MKPWLILLAALSAGCTTAPVSVQTREPFTTVIISGSMLPLLHIAQEVEVVPADYDQLQVGQVVAYRPYFSRSPFNYVHMLKAKRGNYWVVQGINNPKPDDSFMTRENFVGLVVIGKKAS